MLIDPAQTPAPKKPAVTSAPATASETLRLKRSQPKVEVQSCKGGG